MTAPAWRRWLACAARPRRPALMRRARPSAPTPTGTPEPTPTTTTYPLGTTSGTRASCSTWTRRPRPSTPAAARRRRAPDREPERGGQSDLDAADAARGRGRPHRGRPRIARPDSRPAGGASLVLDAIELQGSPRRPTPCIEIGAAPPMSRGSRWAGGGEAVDLPAGDAQGRRARPRRDLKLTLRTAAAPLGPARLVPGAGREARAPDPHLRRDVRRRLRRRPRRSPATTSRSGCRTARSSRRARDGHSQSVELIGARKTKQGPVLAVRDPVRHDRASSRCSSGAAARREGHRVRHRRLIGLHSRPPARQNPRVRLAVVAATSPTGSSLGVRPPSCSTPSAIDCARRSPT